MGMDRLKACAHFFEVTTKPNCHAHLVAAHIAQSALAAAFLGKTPTVGHGWITHEIFLIHTVKVDNVTNPSFINQFLIAKIAGDFI